MSHEIHADYAQQFLLPRSLEEWVPADHPSRFIRDFVEVLDLSGLGFKVRPSGDVGRPNYSSDLMVKAWLYGFMHKIRSSRKLEAACRSQIGLLWLLGTHAPDHNSLWRFWRDNKVALRSLFKQSVKVAVKSEMVGFALQALDGTKIPAQVSRKKALHRKDLVKEWKGLSQAVSHYAEAVEEASDQEGGEYRLPEEMQDANKRKAEIEEALRMLSEEQTDHLHPGDLESRMMKTTGGIEFAYNGQVVSDAKEGIIVAEDVTNEETDRGQLTPMLDEVKENLGQVAKETLADGGYHSGAELKKAEEKGYEVLVSPGSDETKEGEYRASQFEYDALNDCVICPEGQLLSYERTKRNRRQKYAVRVYRGRSCSECPVRDQCTGERRGRSIEIAPHHLARIRQRRKRQDPKNQQLLAMRKQIVEPTFGWIKEAHGFRRWSVRGLENVRTQWALVCTAINLAKLYKLWRAGNLQLACT